MSQSNTIIVFVSITLTIISAFVTVCSCQKFDQIDHLVHELQFSLQDCISVGIECDGHTLGNTIDLNTIQSAYNQYAKLDSLVRIQARRISPIYACVLDTVMGGWQSADPEDKQQEDYLRIFVLDRFASLYPIYIGPKKKSLYTPRIMEMIEMMKKYFEQDNTGFTKADFRTLRIAKVEYRSIMIQWRDYHNYFGQNPFGHKNKLTFRNILRLFEDPWWQRLTDIVFEPPPPRGLNDTASILQYYCDAVLADWKPELWEEIRKRRASKTIENQATSGPNSLRPKQKFLKE